MRVLRSSILEQENDRLFLWVPVFFGTGVGVYFSLVSEPSVLVVFSVLAAAFAVFFLFSQSDTGKVLATAMLLCAFGLADAKLRSVLVDAPVLQAKTRVVALKGWLEKIEPKVGHGQRLTIRPVAIERIDEMKLPYRVSIQNNVKGGTFTLGEGIVVKAVLNPLGEPARPGGFDFARKAYFKRIGAVGYTVSIPEWTDIGRGRPWDISLSMLVGQFRAEVSRRIFKALPGENGALANALITGKRGGISKDVLVALRHSGLAHVLAISGLHMVLMAGSIYWLVRAFLALFPRLVLYYPIKKWAAVLALMGGAGYLILSGASIATERAFIMITVMFAAILLDRPALSLRNVAVAALIVLIPWPEALFDVGFQMSFAAVVGLVALFEKSSESRRNTVREPHVVWPGYVLWGVPSKLIMYLRGIAYTTMIASIAVAPIGIFHFHKLAQYGLLANLAAMPLVGFVIMPMALLSLMLMPFGLEAASLFVMAFGIEQLVRVARNVTELSGSVLYVPSMPVYALVLIVLGGLWFLLWRKRWRYFGLLVVAAGICVAPFQSRPDILIDRDAKTFAVRIADGKLSAPKWRAGSYSVGQWLLADGDGRSAKLVQQGKGFRCDKLGCVAQVKGKTISFVMHAAALGEDCRRADILIVTWPLRGASREACEVATLIIDRVDLKKNGSHAISIKGDEIRVKSVAQWRGSRPWVRKQVSHRDK